MGLVFKVKEIINIIARWGRCRRKRNGLFSIIYGTFWCLWRSRNDRIFNRIASKPAKIIDDIKAMVYVWHKQRSSNGSLNWIDWCDSPISCL